MNSGELIKNAIIILIAGITAALINLYRLPLFFEAEFIFGPFLAIMVTVYRGPMVGLLVSLIGSITLFLAWNSYWVYLTFGLEALFIGIIYQYKKINVILLVMAYWILIGMPVSWYSISQYEHFLDSHRTAILIKQLTNAILYAHIAALVIHLPITRKFLNQPGDTSTSSIKEQSSHIISSLLITVGVLFFFYNLNQSIKVSGEKFSQIHDTKHDKLQYQLELKFDTKIKLLNEFKHVLAKVWDDDNDRETAFLEFNERYPIFRTMLIADKNANLINSSPPELVRNVKAQKEFINIADREYFQQAINSQNTFISSGFKGRGFGNDLITAFSVGIPSMSEPNVNVGVLEGSVFLTSLKHVKVMLNNIEATVDGVLLDRSGQILMASEHLDLELLDEFKFIKGVDTFYQHDLVNLIDADGNVGDKVYYFKESEFEWGWKLITMQDEEAFANLIEQFLIIFVTAIVSVVLISKLLAFAISHSWSYHMRRLNQLIVRGVDFEHKYTEFEGNDQLPEEIKNLYQEIKNSRLEIIKMNQELQNTVAERTEKLQLVNAQLNVMAREDALTKLNNRRVFNEKLNDMWEESRQNLILMSMLIIDIDHFKKVNDTFGHPVGDEVLVHLAEELSGFKHGAVKCVARLGGEEFCLLLNGAKHDDCVMLAEEIRKHIEEMDFHVGIDKTIAITVSVGVATINPNELTSSKLYQLTDNALYQAKHSGRNQVKDQDMSR